MVGIGATATVWRAHPANHPRRTVAIKRIRRDASLDVGRLHDEADVLAELDDVHVVRIIEVIDDDDGPAIVMQYAAGGSLADLLATGRRLTPGELVAVAAPVAQALASAHARGLVHGDVKPSNVLLTSEGQPLLADFGVARAAGRRAAARGLEGTDDYVAPECVAGAAPDGRADIYALGVVCAKAVDLAGSIPPRLAAVIERATHPDPGARFLRAQDLAWALRNAVDHDAVRPPRPAGPGGGRGPSGDTRRFGPGPPKRTTSAGRRRRRWPLAVAGGMAVAAVGVTAGVWKTPETVAPARVPGPRRPGIGPAGGLGSRRRHRRRRLRRPRLSDRRFGPVACARACRRHRPSRPAHVVRRRSGGRRAGTRRLEL